MGVDFCVKTVKIPDRENLLVELYLFDTSGHALYKDLRSKFWSGTSLLLACYDCTSRESFNSLTQWIAEVKKCMPFGGLKKSTQMQGVLVATKCDQSDFSQVTQQEAMQFAQQHQLAFFETSAVRERERERG